MLKSLQRTLACVSLAALAVFAAIPAHAAGFTVELNAELPVTREDGSDLATDEIGATTIYRGDEVLASQPGAVTTVTVELPACTANGLTATVTDKAGLESAPSAALSVSICRPSPPRLSGFRIPPAQ